MPIRVLYLAVAVLWFAFSAKPGYAEKQEPVYRILEGRQACLPCGSEPPYLVIGSLEEVSDLHAMLTEKCGKSESPNNWRQSVIGLGVDFRFEAIITMYEVIGSGGHASLDIAESEDGILKASINWDRGSPPYAPIATAACFAFAVKKAAIKRVDILPGGVLSKNRSELSLIIPAGRPNKSLKPTNPALGDR